VADIGQTLWRAFRVIRARDRKRYGLGVGESGIRTPEILWNPMGGVRPDFGTIQFEKSICAAEIAVTRLGDEARESGVRRRGALVSPLFAV